MVIWPKRLKEGIGRGIKPTMMWDNNYVDNIYSNQWGSISNYYIGTRCCSQAIGRISHKPKPHNGDFTWYSWTNSEFWRAKQHLVFLNCKPQFRRYRDLTNTWFSRRTDWGCHIMSQKRRWWGRCKLHYITLHYNTYLPTYIHTYIVTYIHTYMHACIHTYIHRYIHTYIHIVINDISWLHPMLVLGFFFDRRLHGPVLQGSQWHVLSRWVTVSTCSWTGLVGFVLPSGNLTWLLKMAHL
jgi:hypothetical protein